MLLMVLAFHASAACAAATAAQPAPLCFPREVNWRRIATPGDRTRVRQWRDAWTEALAQARAAGHAAEVAREGVLLDPDAAVDNPAPPPGDYACRVIKLGSPDGSQSFVAGPPARCRIALAQGRLTFEKLTGPQRPTGRMISDGERRLILLGTIGLGDEPRAYQYGVDEERDVAGLVERLPDDRWRIAFPRPHFESTLDVIELRPLRGAR